MGAAFGHRSSRAGDPLLHTHVVVANGTQGPDRRWTALDGRALYRQQKTAGYLYQAALRRRLSAVLGVRWHVVNNGVADVVGVPREVIEHFSRRRAEILDRMAERGEHSARAAEVATLDTRRAKDYGVPLHRLREEWRARAEEHGLNRWRVDRVLGAPARRESHSRELIRAERLADRLLSSKGLTRERAVFTRRDVVQAFAEASDGATIRDIEARVDRLLAKHAVVELEPVAGERRYTTQAVLAVERELLETVARRRDEGTGVADSAAREAAIAARRSLSDEQRDLVVSLTTSGDGVEIVRAPAGTGKTFALDAAREAWQASGIPVLGCALSARAACELRDQAGVDATTIARLRRALDRSAALAPGSVLVVDEAGMVGTRDLAALAQAADQAQAKLVLVGDDRQLPEIEAGGAFRTLAERAGAVELREARRQREQWDRDALAALRDGDLELWAREYHQHGRLIAAPSAEQARSALVDDWWQAYERGESALMIAHRRSDVADLNARARARMREAGHLRTEVEVGERAFAVGDRVVTTRNDRSLDVVNGQAGRLVAIGRGRMTVELDNRRIELPEQYARDGHLDHAYATTAHRAQGATVGRTFVLGSDELYREWGYTALSRHRDEARFYVSATPDFLNRAPEPLTTDDDLPGHVSCILATSRAEQLALDGFPLDQADRLGDELERAQERLADAETRLESLAEERSETRWFRRARLQELDEISNGWERSREHWQAEVDGLNEVIEKRPDARAPALSRAHDPLAGLEPPRLPDRNPDRGRDLGRDIGMGMDL